MASVGDGTAKIDNDFDNAIIDYSQRCSQFLVSEGTWYEHELPHLRFFKTKPQIQTHLRPYMSFVRDYQDYGSLACGYGVKVMHKLYNNESDAVCSSWCANRHVPLVKTIGFHHCGKEIARSIVYVISLR